MSLTSPSSAAAVFVTSIFSNQRFDLFNRDYIYLSFLNPYSSRTWVTIKATSKSQKCEVSVANSLACNASMPSNLNTLLKYRALPALMWLEAKPKAKLEQARDLKSVPVQVLATSLSSPIPTLEKWRIQ